MKRVSSRRIAIAGSSPVSMIYALILSRMEFCVTIFTGKILGGAWAGEKTQDGRIETKGTHILMFSKRTVSKS